MKFEKLQAFRSWLWEQIKNGGILIGFIIGVVTMVLFVKGLVHSTATSDAFLHKVASHVRPALIFDEKYSIIADQGGSEYVEDIDISLDAQGNPTQMVVHAKSHLSHEPYLESLTANDYIITAKRGKKHDWVFVLKQFGRGGVTPYRFRMEIIR